MRRRCMAMVMMAAALMTAALTASPAATGTATVSLLRVASGVTQYTVRWTSASGAVSGNPFNVVGGHLQAVKFVPCSGGTQPTDNYDATLLDASGVDVLNGQASNLSNSTGVYLQFNPPFYFPGSSASQTFDLVIANAGNSKCGVATLWVK